MKNCERQDINLAISTHIANYKSPKFLLCDATSTNDLLAASQKSILQVLETKVRIELLQSSHQYLNVYKSQTKHAKISLLINDSQDIHMVKHSVQQTHVHKTSLLDLS